MATTKSKSRATANGHGVVPPIAAPAAESLIVAASTIGVPSVEVHRPQIGEMHVRIVGTAPLACNAFPSKVLDLFQTQKGFRPPDPAEPAEPPAAPGDRKRRALSPKKERPPRDFHQEYLDSLYPLDDGGFGFKAIAFKHAMVGACRLHKGIDMSMAKRIIHVLADGISRGDNVVRIDGTPQEKRVMVRLSDMNRTPDVRYRGEFWPWAVNLRIRYFADMIKREDILALLDTAGLCEGVGEQRPSARKTTGDFGTFRLDESQKGG